VRAAVRDTALLHALDVPTPTLEGYLFPDTYVFPDGTTPRAAVREMGGRRRGREGDVDALAATVLLQQALKMAELPIVDAEAREGGDAASA
jgi:UPF0755 protein